MAPHTRAMAAASAHAVISGKKVAGIYDHTAGQHLQIAAECRDDRVQGIDGDRNIRFGGTLPEIYDAGEQTFVSLEVDGFKATGYDRSSLSFYTATVTGQLVQLYDYGHAAWFDFEAQSA